jgi:UDP-N-acetylglucosamine 2-epimerase (non-hydrolysing)
MLSALFVFGTRPEAIKLAPVIRCMQSRPEQFRVRVAVTAQHREMLDQALSAFGITPDYDLNTMAAGQSLAASAARILATLEPVYAEVRPDIVFVQGDTTTTLYATLAAFYARIPVGHIEAGLRTGDLAQPFPEEMNRVLAGRLAAIHFASTDGARRNLLAEGIAADRIHVTGNSGIDAVLNIAGRLESGQLPARDWNFPDPAKHLIVVTAHRRESFGEGFDNICRAIRTIAARSDVVIVYPVHPNPNVKDAVHAQLDGIPNIHLLAPLDYVPFVDLMRHATILLTDSGGIQEEGPSLGKPVVVMREKTERPEAVEAGTVLLAGTDEGRIVQEVTRLLDDDKLRDAMSRIHNPYGDGHASERIADAALAYFAGPRFEDRASFVITGLTERYNFPKIDGIPAQWQRFAPHVGKIPGQIGWTTYGVCFNFDGKGNMDYMCGVEVSDGSDPPPGFGQLRITEQRYAVFLHRDHISKIKRTWDAIFSRWIPASGHKLVPAPQFEAYGEDFNPQTGNGVVEIWIPIER